MTSPSSATARRSLIAAALATLLAIVLSADGASAGEGPGACATVDVDYATVGSLRLKGTPLGAADGVYALGAGKVKLRFFAPASPSRSVRMMSYSLDNHFTVDAKAALWRTRVLTQSRTSVAPVCSGIAQGTLDGQSLRWSSKVAGYRSDGTLTCTGSMCGKFGAPPAGTSALHDGPLAVAFMPFAFSPDEKTFTMPYTLIEKGSDRTAYLALSGREIARSCVTSRPKCE